MAQPRPIRLSCEGLEIAHLAFSSTIALEPRESIRLCVPDRGVGEVKPRPGAERLPIRFPEICVVPAQRGCDIDMPHATHLFVVSLDPRYCDEQAMKQYGTRCRIDEVIVTMDPFVSRTAITFGISMRSDSPPREDALCALAVDMAKHVVASYASPKTGRKRGGLSRERLGRVTRAIDEGLAGPLSTASLARAAHLSEFHFSRMFRVSTGYSPHAYITLVRMDRARHLLETTSLTLRQVAEAAGYKTQAHFTSVFHSSCGITPAAYRKLRAGLAEPRAEGRDRPTGEGRKGA